MAGTYAFIEFICDALAPLGVVRSRKMMGDYVIYVNEKCVITACDNIAYVKKLPCIADLMADAECGFPYQGAKEAYILDFADTRNQRKSNNRELTQKRQIPKPWRFRDLCL